MRVNTLVPQTWTELKIFSEKSLRETQVFVDSIEKKFRNVNKYQLKNVIHLSTNIKCLQSDLNEFDATVARIDKHLIKYFWEDLKLSICAKLDEKNRNIYDW